jgi:hypothetical protein
MYPIFSYGSPRFSLGDLSVQFSGKNPAGQVGFEPEEEEHKTLSGRTITDFKGWRAKVTLKLWNLRPQDYQAHLKLINIINTHKQTGAGILLQPRFNSGATLSIFVKSKDIIDYKEITNLNAGQSVDLNFESIGLLDEIPKIVNLPRFLMLDATHYLLLGAGGGRLIIPETEYSKIDTTANESFK